MSCNAGVGDRNNLSKGHYSTKVLAPTGGGTTSISLGGGYGAPVKRSQQNRGVRRNPGVQPQTVSNLSLGGTTAPNRTKTGVRRAPQQQTGAAGGSASLKNSGGYGNLDIHSKPSSRVLAQPGGGSSNIFGGGGGGAKKGSNNKKLNASQQRAKASLQSNVFGGPSSQKKSSSKKVTHQPGGGQSKGQGTRRGVKVGHQPGGGQTSMGAQHSSTKRMQPTGGRSNVVLGGGGRGQTKSSTKVLAQTGGNSQGIFAPQGRGQSRKPQARGGGGGGGIFGGPTQNRPKPKNRGARPTGGGGGKAAGGSASLANSGGYGNLDIHSKPSTRVHAPPGGKSNMPF